MTTFAGMKATDCCQNILWESGNSPMNVLALAREAIARGWRGKAQGSEEEILVTTMKSFWTALYRDKRFQQVRPLVYVLRLGA